MATLIKSIKRTMAAEYSRELSAKVFAGQSGMIKRGYRQGAPAGYGLRRLLIDQNGNPKFVLHSGEYKSIHTDRVILVPGPPSEIEVVHRIYNYFIFEKQSEHAIAKVLNREDISNAYGEPWSRDHIHEILTNEKYIGNNVYNRRSQKLRQRPINNPPDMWIRADRCFEPVIEAKLFWEVQRLIGERAERRTDQYVLDRLRLLLSKGGRLTEDIINASDLTICARSYQERFGGLKGTYALIGYDPRNPPIPRNPRRAGYKPGRSGHQEDYMLDCLRELLAQEGRLSTALINANIAGRPRAKSYQRHFGTLKRAYALAGYEIPKLQFLPRGARGRFIRTPTSIASKLLARRRELRAMKRAMRKVGFSIYP